MDEIIEEVGAEEVVDEVQDKARKMGWVPEDEWKGNPDQWRPAEEFVERGENILPIVKKRLEESEKRYAELERQIKATTAQIDTISKQAHDQAKREYEEKLHDLKQKGFQAAQEGDFETYEKVDKEIGDLRPPDEPEITQKGGAEETPVFAAWKNENDWFESDEDATDFALGFAARLNKQIESGKVDALPERDFYDKVAEHVKKKFPDKFSNPNREKAPATEEGGHEAPKSGKKRGYHDLPKNAKQQLKKLETEFETKGWKFDKDQWIKDYFEG